MSEKLDMFDWNSTSLTVDNCKDKLGNKLMQVLVLPTVDYFLPILSEVGFPDYLIQHPEIWKSVFSEFTPLYEKAIDDHYEWGNNIASQYRDRIVKVYESDLIYDRNKLHDRLCIFDDSRELIDFHVQIKLWKDFLEMLAGRAGKSVAIELEQWICRHYLSDRFDEVMTAWWRLFRFSESVPECLDPILDLINELYEEDRIESFDEEIDRFVDRYREELHKDDRIVKRHEEVCKFAQKHAEKYGDDGDSDVVIFEFASLNDHRPPYGANTYLLERAWLHTQVIPVLQLFASSLNSEQINTVMQWAKEFYDGDAFHENFHNLCPDELITTEVLFSNFTSVLDNPNL